MNHIFGTDGIRAKVGQYPLDEISLIKAGRAIDSFFKAGKVFIGCDTRQSGPMIKKLLLSGLTSSSWVIDGGIMPTPAVSYTLKEGDFDFGIMITASHNPFEDNGIKIFQANGEKLTIDQEQKIEGIFFLTGEAASSQKINLRESETERQAYIHFLATQIDEVAGNPLKIVIDCANGAASHFAAEVFNRGNIHVKVIHARPDGKNINRLCGATDLKSLQERVVKEKADWGFAFDGDGDRVMVVDAAGHIIDGDYLLFLLADYMLATKIIKSKDGVVGTLMSNLALEKGLMKKGLRFCRAPVGDRNVYMMMKENNSWLGGEQSGHIILRHWQNTGDGMLTAIWFLKAIWFFDLKADELYRRFRLYPQATKSIMVKEKKDIETWPELQELLADFTRKHGCHSRVLVRYSGTEPKIRVMIESEKVSIIEKYMKAFLDLIKSQIGGKDEIGC